MAIVTPPFRPTVLAVLTPRERQQLAAIVEAMFAFGLSYVQSMVDGHHDYALQPPIDTLVLRTADAAPLSYAVKQVSF